jgi:hypothetical protein
VPISPRIGPLGSAAAILLFTSFSVEANTVQLQKLTYEIRMFGYEAVSGGFAFSQEADVSFTSPLPNQTPLPLSHFIRSDSDPRTTVDPGSTYYGTASRLQKNETLSQVSGTVQLTAHTNGGFFPRPGTLGMYIAADTLYQVMVVESPDKIAPSDVKGVPVIGTTKGSTQCTGGLEGQATALVVVGGATFARADCPPGINPDSFDKSATGAFPTGVPQNIDVEAYGGVFLQVGGFDGSTDKGFFFASADPSFEIDPSFPYAKDFELVYSPGFTSTGVPEPSSLLLLALGAPLTFVLGRRARWRRVRPLDLG